MSCLVESVEEGEHIAGRRQTDLRTLSIISSSLTHHEEVGTSNKVDGLIICIWEGKDEKYKEKSTSWRRFIIEEHETPEQREMSRKHPVVTVVVAGRKAELFLAQQLTSSESIALPSSLLFQRTFTVFRPPYSPFPKPIPRIPTSVGSYLHVHRIYIQTTRISSNHLQGRRSGWHLR